MDSGQRVEAVEKALSILDAFSEDRMSLSLSEISRETGISKSSLPRLLNSLILFGFIARDPSKRYALGSNVWRLGALFRRRFDLGEKVRPELRQLVELTGETASYYVREQEERICLYRQNSPNPVRHHLDEGSRLSIDRGAAGHALSATDTSPDDIFVSVGERNPEVAAVAVRISSRDGELRGALCVSGICTRFDETARQTAADLLLDARRRLCIDPAESAQVKPLI
ncbi:IclR family transcriptional regulator [Paracoccus aerodenitrificans]|uniref:IclR family transcriptional regulator n=1 Tax=Paracoccus aerodenitrificans TaxID=3017781 RepID=UPI0022F0E4AC|nr:IclR family transcriptional regulator [Paracoccus aerodenitrificans]WBU63624.1 IclR family transcriptional regulator [Paracoccus aerodenitrificans]